MNSSDVAYGMKNLAVRQWSISYKTDIIGIFKLGSMLIELL